MSRQVSIWVGKTPDTPIPARVKDRIFEKYEGYCPKCSRQLQPGKWECDHIIPLILGGDHNEANLQPLCSSPCHRSKTRLDVKLKAKVARVRKRHLGIKKPRTITRWRKFNGDAVYATRDR